MEEVHVAIFSMNKFKAPGHDGFPQHFSRSVGELSSMM
jgi:hypothetical protein